MTTYFAGSSIADIASFDRSQHVYFNCSLHPAAKYFSKDPSVSTWFPANDVAAANDNAQCEEEVACGLSCPEMILSKDYVVN